MFQLYLKKEQYQKVSSKFKDHFHNRQEKITFVTSKDHKIEEKMKAFNQLINDDFHEQKISTKNKDSRIMLKQNNLTKSRQTQQTCLRKNITMNQRKDQLSQSRVSKNNQKQNIFVHKYQQEKQQRRNQQHQNFRNTLKQSQNLKLPKTSHRKQRFSTQLKSKIYQNNNVFELKSPKNFYGSLRTSPVKQTCVQNDQNEKKKSKFKKYFVQSNGHKKHLSQVFHIERNYINKKSNKYLQKSSLSKTFCPMPNLYKNTNKNRKDNKNNTDNQDEDMFKDDTINEKMKLNFPNKFILQNKNNQDLHKNNLQKMPTYLLNPIKKRGFHSRHATELSSISSSMVMNQSIQRKKIDAVKNLKFL